MVGKLVERFCHINSKNAEEKEDLHKGAVLEKHGKSICLIRYNEFQDQVFSRNLWKYLSSDRVRITSVTIYDFIYANTKHLYTDVASNEDIWRDAKVVDIDMESPDMILSFI